MTNIPYWMDESDDSDPDVVDDVDQPLSAIELAVETSLSTTDDSSMRIYINPIDTTGFIRLDNQNIVNWFDLAADETLVAQQFADDDLLPQIAFHPYHTGHVSGFRIEAQIPTTDQMDLMLNTVGVITPENLIELLQSFVDDGFSVYTDYNSLSN